MPLRLDDLGVAGATIGAVFLVSAAVEAVISPLAGRASDRAGRMAPIRAGLIGATVMAVLLPLPNTALLVGVAVVFSFVALATFWAPGMAMLSDAAEASGLDLALAFAISNLAWALGHIFGAGVGGAVADATTDSVPYTALAVLCALTLVGLTASRRRREAPERLAAVRPGRGAALAVQLERQLVLEPLGRLGRVAAAAEAAPGRAAELVLAAVLAAGRDGARVAAGLALRDPPEDRWARARCGRSCGARERALKGLRPSAPRVSGPTMPSGTRSCLRWKRLTARSVIGPKTPSAVSPELALDAAHGVAAVAALDDDLARRAAPPEPLAPGSASAGTRRRREQRGGHEQARETRPTHGIEDPCTNSSPFQCLRGELTGSRRKVALRDVARRDSPQRP